MAGKKKGNDDAGMSKTARASSLKKGGKKEGFIPAAPEHMKRIVSLGGGSHAYLMDPRDGKTHHLAVGSEKWDALLLTLADTDHGVHIEAEIRKLGWDWPSDRVEAIMEQVEANDAALFAALDAQEG